MINQNFFNKTFLNLRIRPIFNFSLFFIYSFLFRIPYLPFSILKYATLIFVFAFVFYFVNILINHKKFIKTPYLIFLGLFLVSNILSFFLFEKGKVTFSNSDVLNHIVLLLLLFPTQVNLFDKEHLRDFELFLKLVLIWNTSMILISEFMLFANYSGITCTGYDCHYTGINGTRLYGVYADPNYASILAMLSIVIAIYFLLKSNKKIFKILLSISIAISYIFIIFTYSRTGFISLVVTICVLSFLYFKKIRYKTTITSILVSISIVSIILILPSPIRSSYNSLYTHKIERNSYVENIDISNNRFDIWSSGINAFFDHPILGIGFKNIKPYFTENYPNTYIAQHDKAYELHNVILNISISQGIIGLIPFILFTFLIIKRIWKVIIQKNPREEYFIILILTSIIVSISCASMFISDILYMYTPSGVIFWITLGTLIKTIPSIETS